MNKAEFIAAIAEKSTLTKSQAEIALKATFDVIEQEMIKQEKIAIPSFGIFSTRVREERKGRNPSTGKEMVIPKAIVASFKAATQLKERINKQRKS